LITIVSGQPIRLIRQGQVVQGEFLVHTGLLDVAQETYICREMSASINHHTPRDV